MKKEKSCGAIIIDNNKVLIIKSKKGNYGFPKGHMEDNETEIETAIREVKEETNLDIKVSEKNRYLISYTIDNRVDKEVVYFIGHPKTYDIVPQVKEVDEVMWVDINDVVTLLQFENIKKLWQSILKSYRNGEFYE